MNVDYLIVGAGLTGATIARMLADAGRDVLVLDRRSHIGGNVHDHVHSSGVRIHTYGPHYFRTSSDAIWQWANRFGMFYKYEAAVVSNIGGELIPWPLAADYIRSRAGDNWEPGFIGNPSNLQEAALALMPQQIYDLFVKEYNEKQWGVPCTELIPELCRRFDVRQTGDKRLTPRAKYQGLPVDGYAAWTRSMLEDIPVALNYDYLTRRNEINATKCLVFTGPIDELFGFVYGPLQYRGQRRTHAYLPLSNYATPHAQINNPTHAGGAHIRTIEWKHLMRASEASAINGTVVTTETPYSPSKPGDYEYPFPDKVNADRFQQYRAHAEATPRLVVAGRLGEYKYYDMDQAIARAMMIAGRLMRSRAV